MTTAAAPALVWYPGPPVTDIAPGDIVHVEAGGQDWIVLGVAGQLYALAGHCTHTGDALADVGAVDGEEIECCSHGARFAVATGEVRSFPATKPLATAEVRVGDDGRIEIGLPDDGTGTGAGPGSLYQARVEDRVH